MIGLASAEPSCATTAHDVNDLASPDPLRINYSISAVAADDAEIEYVMPSR
jgi:hypothetical protein